MSTTQGGSDNGKVTAAVLGEKMAQLIDQNAKLIDRFDKHLEQANNRDKQLAVQATQITAMCTTLGDHAKELDTLDDKIDKASSISNWWNGANSALGVIATTIAGLIGIGK